MPPKRLLNSNKTQQQQQQQQQQPASLSSIKPSTTTATRKGSGSSSGSSMILLLFSSPKILLSYIFVGSCCFYSGLLMGGAHFASTGCVDSSIGSVGGITTNSIIAEKKVKRGMLEEKTNVQKDQEEDTRSMDCFALKTQISQQSAKIALLEKALEEERRSNNNNNNNNKQAQQSQQAQPDSDPRFLFPKQMEGFLGGGAALVDRTSFAERFDVGVPLQESGRGNEHVLLLYGSPNAFPDNDKNEEANTPNLKYYDNPNEATKNCDTLNLILAQPGEKTQCFALLGQYRSHHIYKFMRLPSIEGQKLNSNVPLRLVNRGAQASGRLSVKVPRGEQTSEYWNSLLINYLSGLDTALVKLKKYADKSVNENNTLVVMVCNHGQSELLMNWACSSKARGFDTSSVLVFATDSETYELATGLGLNVYYDEKNYGHIPKRAAGRYADRIFTQIMMAKVYCVQMTMMLGYDLLFQDVDVVWYRNPLDFFQDKSSKMYNYDIYFQDDGSRGMFYAPYSANTGMYFVRNNDRTRYFFNSLLLSGDLISATHSHQIALVSLLSEHASLYNLKVKVLSRDTEFFPGGFTYHKRPAYMKDLFAGKVHPYIFHMSWTENKKNKQSFFRQMGNWYLQDQCIASTVDEILKKDKSIVRVGNSSGYLVQPCCSKEPLIKCFFKDKPSIIPCKDSVSLDQGRKSFW